MRYPHGGPSLQPARESESIISTSPVHLHSGCPGIIAFLSLPDEGYLQLATCLEPIILQAMGTEIFNHYRVSIADGETSILNQEPVPDSARTPWIPALIFSMRAVASLAETASLLRAASE